MAFYIIKLNATEVPSFAIEDERSEDELAEALVNNGFLKVQPVEFFGGQENRQISNSIERILFLGFVVSIHKLDSSQWEIERI
ncbi:hypothetical protein FHT87_004584 [Rhizobium sp. BK316]|uniref:hypothetical protein n=1 Tax=Rhizobium sp. BK316 TaxID=2587053 RepID=UPI00161D8DC6|nr:hypothetical protein [Rhizobium sp. BK316]MBB3410652.1 hypothetical protein [Rhizobium sp. BK316]